MSKKEIKILEVGTPEITSEIKLTYKKYDENETYIQSLKHIRDNLNKMIDNEYDRENIKLQSIINRAIDYIENNDLYTQDIDYDYDDNMVLSPPTDELERKELLNILRGEDEETK